MISKLKKIGLVLLFLIGPGLVQAAELDVSARVDKTSLSVNEIVKYTIEVRGARNVDVPAPNFKDFQIRSGPSQSSQIQIINGEMSVNKSISWWVSPLKSGKVIIPSLSIKHQGQNYSTEQITLTVASQSSNQKAQLQSNRSSEKTGGKDIFFVAEPAKSQVYNGEQLNVNFVLYFRTKIKNFSRAKLSEGKNFWVKELKSSRHPDVTRVNIQGKQYNRAILQRMAFFPTKAGELVIDPMEIKLEVPDSDRNNRRNSFFDDPFFDDPFFSRTKVISISSPAEKIQVKPLPENMPDYFSGGVGKYDISVNVDTREIKENEAFTLSYTVKGKGHINSVALSEPVFDFECEVFEPKINRESEVIGTDVTGSVTYKYVIIPRQTGKINIPAYNFSYFDTDKNDYVTQTAKAIQVVVKPDDKDENIEIGDYSQDEVALLKQDIRYINTNAANWHKQGQHFYDHLWFWLINLGAIMIVAGTLIYKQRQRKFEGNKLLIRKRDAGKIAKKHIKESKEKLKNNDLETAVYKLYAAVSGFIADRTGLPKSTGDAKEISAQLRQSGVPDELIKEVAEFLKNLELKKYAPEAITRAEIEKLLNKGKSLIKALKSKI